MSIGMCILPNDEDYKRKIGDIITLETTVCFQNDCFEPVIEEQVRIIDIIKEPLQDNLKGFTKYLITYEDVEE